MVLFDLSYYYEGRSASCSQLANSSKICSIYSSNYFNYYSACSLFSLSSLKVSLLSIASLISTGVNKPVLSLSNFWNYLVNSEISFSFILLIINVITSLWNLFFVLYDTNIFITF
mmetsp:Transcript_13253/g.1190  ORF Transcript_13253/g.1190 Transcript_13253/m.1190 type:complete len:115 (+) Transcript_13253:334-678(+)